MDDFNDFFDDPHGQQPERTPIYHTPDPPRRASKANVALIISIIIAVIMTLVVIVNVILLAGLKDTIAKEYADKIAQQTYDQYSEAVRDALNGTDIIDDVTANATQGALDALKSTVGEIAAASSSGVARIYMYNSATDKADAYVGMATAFLITDSDATHTERYMVTNAHCVRYVAKRTVGGGILGGGRTEYVWAGYGKIIALFDGDNNSYTLQPIAYGGYSDDDLSAENTKPDLALLKVTGTQPSNTDHVSLKLAASDYTKPGAPIALIGNPEGIGKVNSISTGCVSQIGIQISSWGSGIFILTDAALNSGNSGGPMVDRLGVVIGVAESKLVDEEIDNMGFALSASTLREFLSWACVDGQYGANISLNLRYYVPQ